MTAINSNRAIRGPVTAVPVVAGKGVRLVADTENNRWVVEADETVLWEGTATNSCTISEAISHFEKIRLTLTDINGKATDVILESTSATTWPTNIPSMGPSNAGITFLWVELSGTTLSISKSKTMTTNFTDASASWSYSTDATHRNALLKVVGINRIASN